MYIKPPPYGFKPKCPTAPKPAAPTPSDMPVVSDDLAQAIVAGIETWMIVAVEATVTAAKEIAVSRNRGEAK